MRRFLVWALVAAVGGCATSPGNATDAHPVSLGGADAGADASTPPPDARPLIDAAPADAQFNDAGLRVVTLTQSSSSEVAPSNAVGCFQQVTHFTTENSYYRAFRLTDHGVTGDFVVTSVEFGVELAYAGRDVEQPATIKIYQYANTIGTVLAGNQMTLLDTIDVLVPDAELTVFTVPVNATIPAGGTVVVEVGVADGTDEGNLFLFGSNGLGQSRSGYLRAPATGCEITEPKSYADLGFPAVHLVLEATGVTTP